MICIYYLDEVFDDQYFKILFDYIEKDEIPHRSYLYKDDTKRYIIGRLLLKKALSEHNICVDMHAIQSTSFGKPYCLDIPYFNITHSNNIILVALSESQIGVDIEYISDINYGLLGKILSQNEIRSIQQSTSPKEKFYSVWTRKEAVLKSNGTGLCNAMDELDTLYHVVLYKDIQYYLKELIIHQDYKCHIASDKEITGVEINKILFSQLIDN